MALLFIPLSILASEIPSFSSWARYELFSQHFAGQLEPLHGDGVRSGRRDVLALKTNREVQVRVALLQTKGGSTFQLLPETDTLLSVHLQWTTRAVLRCPDSADIWVPPFTRPHIQRSETWEPSHWPPRLHSGQSRHIGSKCVPLPFLLTQRCARVCCVRSRFSRWQTLVLPNE